LEITPKFHTENNILLTNSYINQYLFSAKKIQIPVLHSTKKEKELYKQQQQEAFQKFWSKINERKIDEEC
jgi:hypothetical protein